MARIKDSTVEAVRQRVDFVAVVEERTPLRKSGARYTGLCPFHEERTPSFSINAVEKLYHCHGCHKGGDMIGFVRDTQALDFVDAIEWLAARAGIVPEYEDASPQDDARRNRRKRLLALLDDAAKFYERYLWDSPAGSFARDYLAGRGLLGPVCREFRLGLAIGGTAVARGAREKGFTAEEIRAAGLARQNGNDYFEQRLVFPLTDARGAVLGFQARRLHENDPLKAKYVNTPESELFTKGAVVYGLDKARATIAREDRAIVVEGNTDVIALRQAGFEPVVACMGTALTEQQLRELGRLTKKLWLAFDGDAAGQAATLRGMELADRQGFDVKVVALPAGADPADDPNGFVSRIATALPYEVHRTQVEARGADDREAGRRAVAAFLDGRPDSLHRQAAWKWAMDFFGMPIQIRGGGTAASVASPSPRLSGAGDRLERGALAGVIAHRSLTPALAELSAEHFQDERNRALRAHLVEAAPASPEVIELLAELDAWAPEEGIISKANAEEFLLRLRERQVFAELRQAPPERTKELRDTLTRIQEAVSGLEKEAAPD
ncbi:MAG TPA: DNA primase [Gaiellaceae bacterium]|jgi:DNA primase|nr:DNA primase [Gaiellaceae bacterium]